MDDFTDDPEYESPFDELESRLDELSTRVDETSASTASVARSTVSGGYCVGSALATVLSWDSNHALGWAAVHGLLSWLYVAYYVFTRWASVKVF